MKHRGRILTGFLSTVFFTMLGSAAIADDSEIFFTDINGVIKPNVMLILDVSGSMGTADVDGGRTRIAVMKEATKALLDDMADVNVGLMYFGGNEGGYFSAAVEPIETNRDALKTAVDGLSADGNTPLSETLFESMRYFQGGDPFIRSSTTPGVMSGGKYDSPIAYECQPNNVVLLTDGEPTEDENHQAGMEAEVGACSGNCLDEISEHMRLADMNDDFANDQSIFTHTVGFKTDQPLLLDTATNGGGKYVLADDAESLKTAFKEVFDNVLAQSTTFAAPGIAVNTFDRLNHLDALYFAVFNPAMEPLWDGNLKRYKLGVNTDDATGEKEAVILDVDGNQAVDPATGFFKDGARSWWSPSADGKTVKEGGAASQHATVNSSRNVYTYVNSASQSDLTVSQNAVSVGNKANLPKAVFGDATMTDAEHEALINWTRGADVDGADPSLSRKFIADPLHSVPHLIVYGGTEATPETAVYFGDNQGFIHGINGADGSTHFSFIPEGLLANQATLKTNSQGADRIYGMDGTIVSWVNDDDLDGKINDGNDHAYIYSGMRRGGRDYYALDVTDRNSPAFLWQIRGGAGNFAELGQTWSKPVKTKIDINKKQYEVLIFGAGYDTNQDSVDVRTEDSIGRGLYIVDAETGDRLWWAGPTGSGADLELSELKYSVPASPKVLDVTGDGQANQIYFGDMGGQIFRFDITNTNKVADLVTGGRIADLADTGEANARRFYHSPDLFGMKVGGARYLGLIIGSGYQAHPLNEVIDDRIYMLRIPDVTGAPIDDQGVVQYTAITENDLFDTTDNLIQQGTQTEREAAVKSLNNSKGWYIRLENSGEKVLSTSQTINNEVFITTYEPTPSQNLCAPAAGTSRLYHLSVLDGRAVVNYDGVGGDDNKDLTAGDRPVQLNTIGLPPSPQRMRVEDTDIVCVGAECRTVDSITGVVETYWYEE